MSRQYSLVANIVARTDQFVNGMNEATNRANSFAQNFSNKTKAIGEGLNNLGTKFNQYVTLPVAAMGTAIVATGMKFDTQMSKVAAVSGATGKNFEKLRNQAKELGSATQFSASQAAEGMEYLALAGWKTEEIYAAMPGMLNLAAAGALDLGEAADITSDVMSAFGMSASEASHAADVFAFAQANANTNVSQMGEALKYSAPVANALGWSLEETAAATMKLADSGLKGSIAGQAFASSLARLAKPTKKMQDVMADLGLSFFDAEGKMLSMPELVKELETGMEGLTDQQRSAAISTLFGAEAYKHWAILLESGSDTLAQTTKELIGADGAAKTMAETMVDNLGGSVISLKSALEGLAIEFSDLIKDDVREFADFVTELVRKFSNLDEGTKKLILTIGSIGASIGPVLMILGLLIKSVGIIAGVFGAVSAPVLAVVAGIGLLVVAFINAYQNSESFRNRVSAVFEKVREVALNVFDVVSDFIMEKVMQIKEFWNENGTQIQEAFSNVFNAIKAVIDFIMPAIQFVIEMVWNSIKGVFDGALNIILGLVRTFAALFTGDWKGVFEGIKQLTKGAIEFIWNLVNLMMIGRILTAVKSFVTSGISVFQGFWTKTVDIFKNLDTHVWNIITSFVSKIISKLKGFYDEGARIFGTLRTFGETTFRALWTAIKSVAENIYKSVISNLTSMLTSAKMQFEGLLSSATNIFNKIKSAITNPIDTAKENVRKAVDAIKGFFSNMKVKIPMPHFSVSGSFSLNPPSVPSLSVDWYKNGGFFDSPSIIGIGEAGREMALPLIGKQMNPYADAVAKRLKDKMFATNNNINNNQQEIIFNNKFEFNIQKRDFDKNDAKQLTNLVAGKLMSHMRDKGRV